MRTRSARDPFALQLRAGSSARSECAFSTRKILPRAGENARVQDDAFKSPANPKVPCSELATRDSGVIFSPMLALARLLASRFLAQRVFKELVLGSGA